MSKTNSDSHPYTQLTKPDTNNATYIDPQDVDGSEYWAADFLYLHKPTHWQHKNEINAGRKFGPSWYNDSRITFEATRDLINSLSGQLDLTSKQRSRAKRLFIHLDRSRLGERLDLVAYSLCALVVEQDEDNTVRRCHPNVPEKQQDAEFRRVVGSLSVEQNDVMRMYGKLQSQIDVPETDLFEGGGI